MVWLGVCARNLWSLGILENGTIDHDGNIKEILPVTLRYDNEVFGDQQTF